MSSVYEPQCTYTYPTFLRNQNPPFFQGSSYEDGTKEEPSLRGQELGTTGKPHRNLVQYSCQDTRTSRYRQTVLLVRKIWNSEEKRRYDVPSRLLIFHVSGVVRTYHRNSVHILPLKRHRRSILYHMPCEPRRSYTPGSHTYVRMHTHIHKT